MSPERDVSLSSGSLIANALARRGHRVMLLDAYVGTDTVPADMDELFSQKCDYSHTVPAHEPDLEALKRDHGIGDSLLGRNVIECCRAADCVFVAMHGGMGENGMLQATLSALGIKFTGSDYIGCLLAMDKNLSKRMMAQDGIPTAEWVVSDTDKVTADEIAKTIGFPCVVKPCGCGSSVGVSITEQPEEFEAALAYASKYERTVLVEKKVSGREFSVGVLGDRALPPIEIVPKSGFYDYANKYQSGQTTEICPASLTPEQLDRISDYAVRTHRALGLGSYSRVDFILDTETDDFVCLEANALPGMTPTSLLPQEAAAAGISYEELCEMIANSAK